MTFNELAWVDFLKKKVKAGKDVLTGIGDDCAQVKVGREKVLLKSDLFIEGVHFDREKISFKNIGARAVCRVLSDFAACAGLPKFIGVSAGIPAYVKQKQLKEILSGVLFCGKKYKFSLVGGDTAKSPNLFLDVWGLGVAKRVVLRSGAREGDYIFVSGRLGERSFFRPFEPRINEAQKLANRFKINAMIDISDGFILDLYRILKESGQGALIYKEKVPVTKGDSDFYRGEDYELLFTVDQGEKELACLKKKFYFVGRIKNAKFGYKIKTSDNLEKVKLTGYTHF